MDRWPTWLIISTIAFGCVLLFAFFIATLMIGGQFMYMAARSSELNKDSPSKEGIKSALAVCGFVIVCSIFAKLVQLVTELSRR